MVWLRIGDSLRKVIFSFCIFSVAVEVFGRQWLADKWQSRAISHLIPSGQLASQDISYSSSSPLSFFRKPRRRNPQIEREGGVYLIDCSDIIKCDSSYRKCPWISRANWEAILGGSDGSMSNGHDQAMSKTKRSLLLEICLCSVLTVEAWVGAL